MKTKQLRKVLVTGLGMAFMLLAFSSCSKKVYFSTSPVAPAARGYAKIKKDKNKNYNIQVSISNLAEVDRLPGNRKVYVLWMGSNGENPKNMGRIDSDTKRFSKKLTASFHSVSSTKPTRIFITAEEDGNTQQPGNYEVLSTEII